MDEFIAEHLEYYDQTQGVLPGRLEDFGDIYQAQGYLTQTQLYEIAYESSTRSAYHVKSNPEDRCREVTENVLRVEGDFSQIQLLTGLHGFKAPTASCVCRGGWRSACSRRHASLGRPRTERVR